MYWESGLDGWEGFVLKEKRRHEDGDGNRRKGEDGRMGEEKKRG